jgi:hypothetical protein
MNRLTWMVQKSNLGSDHKEIAITIDGFPKTQLDNRRKYINKKMMTAQLNSVDTQRIESPADFLSKMDEIRTACTYTKKHDRINKRYWNEELGALWKLKEEALDIFNDRQHMSDYNRFCDFQDQLKTQREETRKRDKENYVKKIHPDISLKMLWKRVGYISDKPKKEPYNHVTNEKTTSI